MKRYDAEVWTSPPGQPEDDPFVSFGREFDNPLAARLWCGRMIKKHPHATGGANVFDNELDQYVWQA